MRCGKILILAMAALVLPIMLAAPAWAQTARIGGLEDVNFGTVVAVADQSNSQNVSVCSMEGWFSRLNYSVTASGTGAGGAFQLTSGAHVLPYEVRWADAPNQTSGTALQPGVPSPGFGNAATLLACLFEPDTASLTVRLRAADLAVATAGNYSGTLQITIRPE